MADFITFIFLPESGALAELVGGWRLEVDINRTTKCLLCGLFFELAQCCSFELFNENLQALERLQHGKSLGVSGCWKVCLLYTLSGDWASIPSPQLPW